MSGPSSTRRDIAIAVFVVALLVSVNFLPPDSSLSEVRSSGMLRACVPTEFPPLVTGGDDLPGIDIELLEALAEDIGVRLALNTNSAMGRDFNPRNWRVTRSQCSVLAGGVVATETTRSFLETSPSYLRTGWSAVAIESVDSLQGASVGFYAGISGLDRIELGRYLRQAGANVELIRSRSLLEAGLRDGQFEVAITEALTGRQVAQTVGGTAYWLQGDFERHPVVFGLWKGDLSLKRQVVRSLERLKSDGIVDEILARYEVKDEILPCPFC